MATVDAIVMGRNTFETVLTFDAWPFGKKPVVVLTTRPFEGPPPRNAVLRVYRRTSRAGSGAAGSTRDSTRLRRRRNNRSAFSRSGTNSADDYYADSCATRQRHSVVWTAIARDSTRTP